MSKTFFGKIIAALGKAFKSLFEAGKDAFENLPQEQQRALIQGSDLVNIINEHLEKSPAHIRAAIEKKYPGLDVFQIETVISVICQSFGTAPINIEAGIDLIQKRLSNLEGKFWASFSRTAAALAASVFAPKGMKFEAIASLIGIVYHSFIKRK